MNRGKTQLYPKNKKIKKNLDRERGEEFIKENEYTPKEVAVASSWMERMKKFFFLSFSLEREWGYFGKLKRRKVTIVLN